MFAIQRKEGWGNALFADRDLLPGAEVMQDRALLRLNHANTKIKELKAIFINSWLTEAVNAYYDFRDVLSAEEKVNILALPINTNCPFAIEHRKLFHDGTLISYFFAMFEINRLIHVLCVMRQRIFRAKTESTWYVYGTASLLYPSCTPNCHLDMQGGRCVCRALVPVKAGDLLTVSMNEEWNTLSVAVRRHHLLQEMDFTCHCARCDALGDDTRQFPCFNKQCTGYHWVCQPRELKSRKACSTTTWSTWSHTYCPALSVTSVRLSSTSPTCYRKSRNLKRTAQNWSRPWPSADKTC
jgi:hypothetical protein